MRWQTLDQHLDDNLVTDQDAEESATLGLDSGRRETETMHVC